MEWYIERMSAHLLPSTTRRSRRSGSTAGSNGSDSSSSRVLRPYGVPPSTFTGDGARLSNFEERSAIAVDHDLCGCKGKLLANRVGSGKQGFYRRQTLNFSDGGKMRTSVLVEEPESLFNAIEIAQFVGAYAA